MGTKVIVLGQEPKEEKKLKPIEFVKSLLSTSHTFRETCGKPSEYKNVELIALDYGHGYSLMFAYDNNRNHGCLFLGHFNDGVVE